MRRLAPSAELPAHIVKAEGLLEDFDKFLNYAAALPEDELALDERGRAMLAAYRGLGCPEPAARAKVLAYDIHLLGRGRSSARAAELAMKLEAILQESCEVWRHLRERAAKEEPQGVVEVAEY